ncbi:MAG: hypothetical protein ACRDHX_13785 [Chloroflexota bacterium]
MKSITANDVRAVLRVHDHPLLLAKSSLRRVFPAQDRYDAGRRVRDLLHRAMKVAIEHTHNATDIDGRRVHGYLTGVLADCSDAEIGRQLQLSRQSVNSSVRELAADMVADIIERLVDRERQLSKVSA